MISLISPKLNSRHCDEMSENRFEKGLRTDLAYSDGTLGVQYVYNQLALLTQVTDSSGVRTIAYDQYNELLSESLLGSGKTHLVTENRDNLGRNIGYVYKKDAATQQTVTIGYAADGRIGTAAFLHGSQRTFVYNYLANSHLLQTLDMPNNMSLTLGYESDRDLLTSMRYKRASTSVIERDYTYDDIARTVTRRTARQGGVKNDTYAYNSRNELTAATLNPGNFTYDYDNIGNRKTAQEIAEEFDYNANELNQYTSITQNEETPFVPTFDAAGNQTLLKTNSGIWTVVYNANNRPISFTSQDQQTLIECAYDYLGRRFSKKVTVNNTVTLHQRYIYRGYLQIACLDLTRTAHPALWYITWDPSQPVATRPLAIQKDGTWYCYAHDLTKNVCEVLGQAGYIRTTYSYTPFGQVTATGDVTQPIQWSSEYHDDELALVYYNYRHYNPLDGRWPSRDPIGERGGMNLYGFVRNNGLNLIDIFGLSLRKTGWTEEIEDVGGRTSIKGVKLGPATSLEGFAQELYMMSANNLLSDNLIAHYLGGTGSPYDVGAETRILLLAKKHQGLKHENELKRKLEEKYDSFTCKKEGTFKKLVWLPRKTFNVELMWSYPALGGADFELDRYGYVSIDCKCCPNGSNKAGQIVKGSASLKGFSDYYYNDSFKDAADWDDNEDGLQEYKGGTPYEIIAGWRINHLNVYISENECN